MSAMNFKDFLTSGVCLQSGPNTFKILIGPFTSVPLEQVQASKSATFLYKSNFWDFLNSGSNGAQNFVYSPRTSFDLDREEFIRLLSEQDLNKPELRWNLPAENGFKEQFDWSQNHFKKGDLKKTVPVIFQNSGGHLTGPNIIYFLLNLLRKNNFGWTYASFNNGAGMIGHTPELLLDWDVVKGTTETVALAGTVSAGASARNEILSDLKIRQEHDYVIDDIQLKLSGFSSTQEPTDVLELKHLLHLQTIFKISIHNVSEFLKCAECLHPTAAMGIYPPDAKLLKEFSEFELQKSRGAFAGPLGFIGPEKGMILVPIRNIIFNSNSAFIFSGCGITAESRYESEVIELENKRNSVKKMLGLMDD
jgi:menaquinone-specific isochorismate synthase